ncbi:hypothetical protein B1757_10280 [Acidithiobacillus marinus]|uniref:ABC transporter permease n=1 Tax=Acidithiobacillus marinus TaxID=187490 RepID=A0A2I1DKA1_9PROT|nr:hypothetical protein B1757_10280 [Acidithiobacillus marinus]
MYASEITRPTISWGGLHTFFRKLWQQRLYFVVSSLFLGLATGVAGVGFQVLYAFQLQPMPFVDPSRLVLIREEMPAIGLGTSFQASPKLHQDLEREAHSGIQSSALLNDLSRTTTTRINGVVMVLDYKRVSPQVFPLLFTRPALGTWPQISSGKPDGPHQAVISYDFWKQAFAGNPDAVNRELQMDGQSYQITAVLPKGAQLIPGSSADVFIPLVEPLPKVQENNVNDSLYARLSPGESLHDLNVRLAALAARQQIATPPQFRSQLKNYRIEALPLREAFLRQMGMNRLPWLYFGVGLFLWIIAVFNISNYALLRHHAILRSLGIRQLLGASPLRIFAQLLLEQIPIFFLALFIALPLTGLGSRWLSASLFSGKGDGYHLFPLHFNVWMFVFVFVLLLMGVMIAIVLPLSRSRPASLREAMAGDERTASLSKGIQRLLQLASGIQVALAIAVLGVALSLTISALVLGYRPLGFDPEGVFYASLYFPPGQANKASLRTVQGALRSVPYVHGEAFASTLPWLGINLGSLFSSPHGSGRAIFEVTIGEMLSLLHIPLERGKALPPLSASTQGRSLWVSSDACKRYYPDTDCVGKLLHLGPYFTYSAYPIAGVYAPITWGLHTMMRRNFGIVYLPLNTPIGHIFLSKMGKVQIAMRLSPDTSAARTEIRNAIRLALPGSFLANIHSYAELIHKRRAGFLAFDAVLVVFALLATFISLFGVYVVQDAVQSARRSEYRIRRLLGAQIHHFRRRALVEQTRILLPGVILGIAVAAVLARAMNTKFPHALLYLAPALIVVLPLVLLVYWFSSWWPVRKVLRDG